MGVRGNAWIRKMQQLFHSWSGNGVQRERNIMLPAVQQQEIQFYHALQRNSSLKTWKSWETIQFWCGVYSCPCYCFAFYRIPILLPPSGGVSQASHVQTRNIHDYTFLRQDNPNCLVSKVVIESELKPNHPICLVAFVASNLFVCVFSYIFPVSFPKFSLIARAFRNRFLLRRKVEEFPASESPWRRLDP